MPTGFSTGVKLELPRGMRDLESADFAGINFVREKFLETAQKTMRDWREVMAKRGGRRDTPMKPQVVTHELNKILEHWEGQDEPS